MSSGSEDESYIVDSGGMEGIFNCLKVSLGIILIQEFYDLL